MSGILDSDNPIDFLPVERNYFPSIPVGNTPLWHPKNLSKQLGLTKLYFKDDGVNPTGSFKDRASFLVAAFAKKHHIKEIVVASTGNAGSSMAGVGAAAGLKVKLFLFERIGFISIPPLLINLPQTSKLEFGYLFIK